MFHALSIAFLPFLIVYCVFQMTFVSSPTRSRMKLLRSLASICLLAAAALSVPTQEKRVHHQADLSDRAHDDSHGFKYDHEAFLGKEEAKTFGQLTPEESKDKLA